MCFKLIKHVRRSSLKLLTKILNTFLYSIDQILGKQGSKSKDVYASKISLASRVVKVERQVRSTNIYVHVIHINLYHMRFVYR